MPVFYFAAVLIVYKVINGSTGDTLYTHKESAVSTEYIQTSHTEYFTLLKLYYNSYSHTALH